jgi:hypothetical protein
MWSCSGWNPGVLVNSSRCELAAIRVICYMNSIVVSPLFFFLAVYNRNIPFRVSVVEKTGELSQLSDRLCLGWWSGSCNMWLLGETEVLTKKLVAL